MGSSGSMCVGVTLWFDWGGVVSVCRLSLHTDTTPPPPADDLPARNMLRSIVKPMVFVI